MTSNLALKKSYLTNYAVLMLVEIMAKTLDTGKTGINVILQSYF